MEIVMTYRGSAPSSNVTEYVVSWIGKDNMKQSKVYRSHNLASKLMRWLADKGIEDIDIAVRVDTKAREEV